MKTIVLALYGSAILGSVSALPAGAQQQPPSFAACAACHLPEGGNGIGPSLKGIYGRKAGTLSGFTFSRAMRNAGFAWDARSLDAFIAEPQKLVPGNAMPFSGLPNPPERAAIVEYLKGLQ